jgi:hypothetical protein
MNMYQASKQVSENVDKPPLICKGEEIQGMEKRGDYGE